MHMKIICKTQWRSAGLLIHAYCHTLHITHSYECFICQLPFFSLFSFAAHHKLMAGHSLFRRRRTRKGNLYRKKHPHQLWTMSTDDRKYCRKHEILEKWLGSGGTRTDTHKHTQMTFIQENGEDQPFPKPWCIIFFVPKWNQTTSDLSMMILNNGKTSNQPQVNRPSREGR